MRHIYLVVGSKSFFGAERRFFKIASLMQEKFGASLKVDLAMNSSLYLAAVKVDWAKYLLQQFDELGQLIVVPDSPAHLRQARRVGRLPRLLLSRVPTHCVLHGKWVAFARSLLRRPAVLEVTSLPGAEIIVRGASYRMLRGLSSLRCVSDGVRDRLAQRLVSKFGEKRGMRILDSVATATTPLFDPSSITTVPSSKADVVCSASRFIPRKNVVLVARAFARVLDTHPEWQAKMFGDGEQEDQIRHILERHVSSGRAAVGYSSNMEKELANSKIYVSMIEENNYPSQSVLEALHLENALILSDVGDSYRFLDDERANGRLIELNEDSLVETLTEMIDSAPSKLRSMGEASRKHVADAFSAEKHVNELLMIHFGEGALFPAEAA